MKCTATHTDLHFKAKHPSGPATGYHYDTAHMKANSVSTVKTHLGEHNRNVKLVPVSKIDHHIEAASHAIQG